MTGRHRSPLPGALAALVLSVVASACFFGRGDDTRFYVLAAVPAAGAPSGRRAIGLGPIVLPGYLRRPGIATRIDATRVKYADADRWAEPLPALFSRTLAQDLTGLVGDVRVVPYPWYPGTQLDVVLRVDVGAFEADTTGKVTLDACWSVRAPGSTTIGHSECSSINEAATSADGAGAEADTAALSRAIAELARRMADRLRP